jgi:HEAT repeat protein
MLAALVIMVVVWSLAAAIAGSQNHRKRLEQEFYAWHEAAAQLGLELKGAHDKRSMFGVLNGVPVRVEYKRRARSTGKSTAAHETTTFVAGGDGRIPSSLALRKDSSLLSIVRLVDGSDVPIGDEAFDELAELSQVDAHVCAALSFSARYSLRAWLERGVDVHDGVVVCQMTSGVSHEPAWLAETLQAMARLAQEISVTPDTLHGRLATNAVQDPSAGVRLQNFRYLADPNTGAPRELVVSIARTLAKDQYPSVRFAAARQLGREGIPALLGVASDMAAGESLRADALFALQELQAPELVGVLQRLLRQGSPELMHAALSIVSASRLSALSPAVVQCAPVDDEAVRAAVAGTLAVLAPSNAEATLLQLLADTSADVQRAAAEALGAIGSVAAVEPLLLLAKGLARSELRQAARAAIASIQSRLGDAEAGRLSLADDYELAGAVTVVAEEGEHAGAVSLAEETARGRR